MGVSLPSIPVPNWVSSIFPAWNRDVDGNTFVDITANQEWTNANSDLQLALNHPILTPAILFISKLFSQGEFYLERKSNKNKKTESSFLDLLESPNPLQTRPDFLETLMFVMIAQGVAVVALNRTLGFKEPDSMFVLDYDKIKWPEGITYKDFLSGKKSVMNKYIIYDQGKDFIKYRIDDLLFFYDLPNALQRNPFKVKSRISGLRQTLLNTQDSLIAKGIIIKSNGKELFTTTKKGFPMTPEEKKEIENLFNNKHGLSFSRKRGIVSRSDVTWKSLHIALRDLGLDESTKIDGNLIYTALHIPKDIMSLEAKKTTYNNFKESMVSYLQNEIQPSMDSACAVFNKKDFTPNYRLKCSYEHLPIMQFILIERYKGVEQRGRALSALRSAGLPDEMALELVGLDPTTQLKEISNNSQQNEEGNDTTEEGEEKQYLRSIR